MSRPKRWTRWVLAVPFALVLASAPAGAQLSDDNTRAAARALADEGEALFRSDEFAGALDRFSRAYELVKAPTIAMRHAECLVRLGRWVEASERYRTISRMPLAPDAPEVFKQAVTDAASAAQALVRRLARVDVTVAGQELDGAQLLVDGKEMPRALWGVKWPLDPGKHRIELVKGERRQVKDIVLAEAQFLVITLTLPASSAEPQPVPGADPVAPVSPVQPSPTASPSSADAERQQAPIARTLGWASLGLGGVGLLVGASAGIIALGKRSELMDSCPDAHCPSSFQGDVDGYDKARMASTIGFAVGAVGVGAGLALLLSSPSRDTPPAAAQADFFIGPGTTGIRGTF